MNEGLREREGRRNDSTGEERFHQRSVPLCGYVLQLREEPHPDRLVIRSNGGSTSCQTSQCAGYPDLHSCKKSIGAFVCSQSAPGVSGGVVTG
jgi:hypothetical protein